MNIKRTYPQPDSPREDLGPRERAYAVFKFLLGLEPEDAKKHPQYELIKHAFEQEGNRSVRRWLANAADEGWECNFPQTARPQMEPSLTEVIEGEFRPLGDAPIRTQPLRLPEVQ